MGTETLNSYTATGITLTAAGADLSPFTVTSHGTIQASTSGMYSALSQPVLLNEGTIIGSNGVKFTAGGTVDNFGTISAKSLFGIQFSAGGTVDNGSASALIQRGIDILADPGLVINVGTISSNIDGIQFTAGGTVDNIGTSALISSSQTAIYAKSAAGYLNNSGTIIVGSGDSVQFAAGGTVNNTGVSAFMNEGVFIQTGAGQVNNSGTIAGNVNMTGGGNVINAVSGIILSGVVLSKPGTLSNAGTITASAGYGVRLANNESILNTGTSALISGTFGGVEDIGGGATIINAATITGGKYGMFFNAGPASVSNTGTISGGKYGVLVKTGASTINNAGTIGGPVAIDINGTGNARVVAQSGAVFIGNVEATNTGSNTLEFSGTGATFASIGSQFTGFQTIAFDPASAWTISGNTIALGTTLTITGFGLHDGIDLTGFAASSDTFAANALTLSNGTTNEILDLSSSYLSPNFMLGPDGSGGTVIDVTCFCAGTRILTPQGEVPVENLKPGDLVITAGAIIRPIIWAGREDINIEKHPEPELVRPIRITAGALGGGIPERDLRLSPHHAVRVDGALVEAISLVNHSTIFQEQTGRHVTYHHIELESHDILLAEGCPCESYLDTGSRLRAA